MKFNLEDKIQRNLAFNMFNKLNADEKLIELKDVKKTRNSLQNSALHLYFTLIAEELNNLGLTFNYTGLVTKNLETRYTMEIVKDFIWRPIQRILFKIESTSKINTAQINEIVDILTKHFGENYYFYVPFPNIQDKLHKEEIL